MKTSRKVNSRLSLTLRAIVSALLRENSGQVAVMFGMCSLIIFSAIGGGIDFSRAFMQRQMLSNAARLACQYSTRPSIVSMVYNGSGGAASYIQNVNNYATTYLNLQNFNMTSNTSPTSPFSYVAGGASSVTLSANMNTIFLGVVGLRSLPVGVTISCDNGELQQTNTQPTAAGSALVSESFETPACTGYCWGAFLPSGVEGVQSTPTQVFPANVGYTGQTGAQWVIMGYCLEIDHAGITVATAAQGNYVAELNCDSGTNPDHGLSSISNKSYYAAGSYELRYSFQARVDYPNYDPIYICGSTASDSAWANDTNSGLGTELRNNQINVYFDPNVNGTPGTHTTLDGSEQLAGVNMIDECVYSKGWIQRSVKITVTTPGYYWLSFAADGANDSYGGSLDNIMMCNVSCTSTQGALQDYFPSAWPKTLLFEDGFETPAYSCSAALGHCGYLSNQNLNSDYGTTNGSPPGWPSQTASGWATTPINNVPFYLSQSAQGNQSIQLDMTFNVTVARSFYLDPGYYTVNYDYVSSDLMPNIPTEPACLYAPSGPMPQYAYINANYNDQPRVPGSFSNWYAGNDSNSLAVFMSHTSLVSAPIGGGTQNSTTSYNNPDGTVTTTPKVAPDGLTISNYNPSQVNPLLDYCYYSSSWLTRTTYVEITKSGSYWLTFAGEGYQNHAGATIDDVRLTALNSLYGAAPNFYVTIPTPGPSNGAAYSASPGIGYTFIADPLTP